MLTLADDRVLAGLLRLENIGVIEQWALDVPANGVHHGYTAILSPKSIVAVQPCTEADAICLGAAHATGPQGLKLPEHAGPDGDIRRSA